MKILYIGRHGQSNNDDEGAITYALEKLGHEVDCVTESNAGFALWLEALQERQSRYHFALFNHWRNIDLIGKITIPKVMWCFDLIDYPDPTLDLRCSARKQWMRELLPLIDVGFMTDGDYVAKDISGKLVWLMQGADERVVGKYPSTARHINKKILFTGITKGGKGREQFVARMKEEYGEKFLHVQHGVYSRSLGHLIADVNVMVCPDSPITTRYWSNRIYIATGFGAAVVHPYTPHLADSYKPNEECCFYFDRASMKGQIQRLLEDDGYRHNLSSRGLERTRKEHLYLHRCEKLIQTVKERLKI